MHIRGSISKATQMIAWITRNMITREKTVMLHVYKTVIRPHLEYCVQIWTPVAKHGNWGIIMDIEAVQRRFTRLIDGIGTLSYRERLEKLGLTTLVERRNRGDLIETFKILRNIVPYGSSIFNVSRSGFHIVSNSQSNNGPYSKLSKSFISERVITGISFLNIVNLLIVLTLLNPICSYLRNRIFRLSIITTFGMYPRRF